MESIFTLLRSIAQQTALPNANDFHAAKQAVRKKYKYKYKLQPQLGWHAKEIFTNQQLIRLSIKVKLLTCISLDGPSSGSIMAAALGEP